MSEKITYTPIEARLPPQIEVTTNSEVLVVETEEQRRQRLLNQRFSFDADGDMILYAYLVTGEAHGSQGSMFVEYTLPPLSEFTLPAEGSPQYDQLQKHCTVFGLPFPKSSDELPNLVYECLTSKDDEGTPWMPIDEKTGDDYLAYKPNTYMDFIQSAKPPASADSCCPIHGSDGSEHHWHGPWQGDNKGKTLITFALLGHERSQKTLEVLAQETNQTKYEELGGKALHEVPPTELIYALSDIAVSRKQKESGEKLKCDWNHRFEGFVQAALTLALAKDSMDSEVVRKLEQIAHNDTTGWAPFDRKPRRKEAIISKEFTTLFETALKNKRMDLVSIDAEKVFRQLLRLHKYSLNSEREKLFLQEFATLPHTEAVLTSLSSDKIVYILTKAIEISTRPDGLIKMGEEKFVEAAKVLNSRDFWLVNIRGVEKGVEHQQGYHGAIRVNKSGVVVMDTCAHHTPHLDLKMNEAVQVANRFLNTRQNKPTLVVRMDRVTLPQVTPFPDRARRKLPEIVINTAVTSHTRPTIRSVELYQVPMVEIKYRVSHQEDRRLSSDRDEKAANSVSLRGGVVAVISPILTSKPQTSHRYSPEKKAYVVDHSPQMKRRRKERSKITDISAKTVQDSTSNPLKVVVGIEGRAPRYTKDISAPVSIIRNKPQESQPNRIVPATTLDTILYVLPQRKTIMDEPTIVRHRSTPRSELVQQGMPPIKMPEIGSALEQAFQLKEHSSQRQSIITENEKAATLKQEERQTHEATEHETMKEVNNVLSSTNKIATQTQSEKTTQQIQSENRVSAEVEATKNREAQTALSGVTGSQASSSNPRNLTRQSTPRNSTQMHKQHQNSQPDSKDLGTHEAVSSVINTRLSNNTPQKNIKQPHTHSSRTASRVTNAKQSVTISQGVAGVQSNTGMIIFEPNTLRQDFSQMLQYARKFAA